MYNTVTNYVYEFKKKLACLWVLSDRSKLFRGFSCWSTLFLALSEISKLLLDFSFLSVLNLGFSLLSVLFQPFSLWSVLDLGFSLLSMLLWRSKWSELILGGSCGTELSVDAVLGGGAFSMADINFLRCLMYSGNNSKLQWLPALTHRGSYFTLDSSHSCFPWDQSTTSSTIPCKHQWGF